VREIREKRADREAVKGVRHEVAALKRELDNEKIPVEPSAGNIQLAIGSMVRLNDGVEIGEVESVSPDGRTAIVVFGIVKMKLNVNDLRLTRDRPALRRPEGSMQSEKPDRVPTDLDLRGMNGEEALPLVDKFIDTAMLAGLQRIDIIHGKGTGALRKKVTEFLTSHPRVKSFRLGEWNEGGTGATVLELKS
jgi:DNA mismatch repair protein MutS2